MYVSTSRADSISFPRLSKFVAVGRRGTLFRSNAYRCLLETVRQVVDRRRVAGLLTTVPPGSLPPITVVGLRKFTNPNADGRAVVTGDAFPLYLTVGGGSEEKAVY